MKTEIINLLLAHKSLCDKAGAGFALLAQSDDDVETLLVGETATLRVRRACSLAERIVEVAVLGKSKERVGAILIFRAQRLMRLAVGRRLPA